MEIAAYTVRFYFATVLAVSGLAKVYRREEFSRTLRRQGVLPTWAIRPVACIVPWLEIVLGGLLFAGTMVVATAAAVLILFIGFSGVRAALFANGSAAGCGCCGTNGSRVDGARILESAVLVGLAGFQFWSASWINSLPTIWQICLLAAFAGTVSWAVWRIAERREGHVAWIQAQRSGRAAGTATSTRQVPHVEA